MFKVETQAAEQELCLNKYSVGLQLSIICRYKYQKTVKNVQGDVYKSRVFSDQSSKSQRYSVYQRRRSRKKADNGIGEAGIRRVWHFFPYKSD